MMVGFEKEEVCVYIDAGHGGLDPRGQYISLVNGKKYKHKSGGPYHAGKMFYEGVFNRDLADLTAHKLKELGIAVKKTYHEYEDYKLSYRTKLANEYDQHFEHSIFISIHANAFNSEVRGYEIFTFPGQSKSDIFADIVTTYVESMIVPKWNLPIRSEKSEDGDVDKEKNFAVLRNTRMPAVLIECGFFDNQKDAEMLISDIYQEKMSECIVLAVLEYFTKVSNELPA